MPSRQLRIRPASMFFAVCSPKTFGNCFLSQARRPARRDNHLPECLHVGSRPCFRTLRQARETTQNRLGVELPHLSMGMSGDFVIAVEEGATILRLGGALFGPRAPRSWREGS